MWNATVLSLFPEMFPGTLDFSIAGKALRKNLWSLKTVNIRQFSNNKNGKVDEVPFGGGPGMVINPEVLDKALKSVAKAVGRRIYLTPRGKKFDQEFAKKLSQEKGAVFICGRYEGVDERFLIGAQLVMDATIRLIPEVIGNDAALVDESFERHLLEYPLYTHPRVWKDMEVPEVLLSGNHKKIQMWKLKMSEKLTKFRRPDLWSKYIKS